MEGKEGHTGTVTDQRTLGDRVTTTRTVVSWFDPRTEKDHLWKSERNPNKACSLVNGIIHVNVLVLINVP